MIWNSLLKLHLLVCQKRTAKAGLETAEYTILTNVVFFCDGTLSYDMAILHFMLILTASFYKTMLVRSLVD